LRAKDKSFNADFKIDIDESLGKVNVLAQDLGRVLLNLINNAFYACAERSRVTVETNHDLSPHDLSSPSATYKPMVIVSTKKVDNYIEIRVSDNGNGIPDSIKDKIFQPFFTTKPAGKGTGLGLSLSYDIISKGHGGELSVESKEGAGVEFIILLPIKLSSNEIFYNKYHPYFYQPFWVGARKCEIFSKPARQFENGV
jgi:signal transduction histidine kinase